jgi:hypothetical protein
MHTFTNFVNRGPSKLLVYMTKSFVLVWDSLYVENPFFLQLVVQKDLLGSNVTNIPSYALAIGAVNRDGIVHL